MPDENRLRVLSICSRPLMDSDGTPIPLLDVAEERRRIEKGIKRLGDAARVHFLPEATTDAVKSALRDGWDVVHFTGHGTDDGRLVLEDGYGVAHLLSKEETARMFTGEKAPLVVLSACHSETVARELHAAGVPAVVAVDARVPIADRAAIIFAEHFYAALARGWDVRRAFEDARETVALDPQVGDQKPPLDDEGNAEEPWSKRFVLIGDAEGGAVARAGTRGAAAEAPAQVAGNLHARGVNFVGRAKEIVDVVRAFDEAEAQRVCLHGSGGLGKTELARAVARWYMERERVGAVLWASASHVEGDYKLRDLASLLGIAMRVFPLPVTEQSMFDEQKRVVREFLAGNRALVLLDNWETLDKEHLRELWDFALSLPEEVRVLVTSRDMLPAPNARNIELDTLAPEDAAELFVNIARNAGYFARNPNLIGEELATLNHICERLGGYPLAVEVVAGQTVSRTLKDIWADLQRVPRNVLEGKDVADKPHGIWTSLDLSYNVLPDPEQTLFRRMCVFLAPAPADDIAAITETENPSPLLDTLVKRSLIRMRDGAYSLLPILRDYARDKLTTANQDPRALHERAVNHYGQKNTPEGALTASDHLFELAARFGLREAAETFAGYVPRFHEDLVKRGYWVEAHSKAEQLVAVARALGDKEIEAVAIGALGHHHFQIGEYDHATELCGRAQSLFEASNNRRGVAHTLHQLGILARSQGNYVEAARLYQRSLEIIEELRDKPMVANTLHELGNLRYLQDDYAEAARLYQRSLEIRKELGDEYGIAGTLLQLGVLAQDQGDYGEAARLYQQSLEITKEFGDKSGIAKSLHQLGNLQYLQGDYGEAMKLYRQSLDIKKELGDKEGAANTLGQLGRLSHVQGKLKEALNYYLWVFVILEELHAPHRQKVLLKDIASVRHTVGKEQFAAWLRELSTDAERIISLLEQSEADDEQREKEFIKWLADAAEAMVVARRQGGAEEQAELAQQLAEVEAEVRKQNAAGVAEFFGVLRGLLAEEDVGERIAALEEPMRRIAERARAACEAEGGEG
ncbi:MAG TPA: tetratricopeptide repeat protein [Pyrinomonadaceae bacterium]